MTIKKPVKQGLILLFCFTLLVNSGCSVLMAVLQPDKKDLSVLQTNVPRDQVIAELGQPVSSEMKGDERVEIYQFRQGYHKGSKVLRALFHGAADVFTWGLWEVIGTPAELVWNGTEMAVQVTYDQNDLVKKVVALKGDLRISSENK